VPEGDTIHKIAARLAPRLVGQTLERVTTQGLVRDLAGRAVTGVAAHGKHLVIDLDDGTYLRTHLGMNGRFRAFARAEGDAALARMSPGRASLAITTADGVYAWIGARTVEISPRRAPMHGAAIASLGPDLLAEDFDPREAAARAAGQPRRAIADALLDQRIAAGIGNVYKSEVLFLRGVDPCARVGALDAARLEEIYATARELMVQNMDTITRTTRDPLLGQRTAPSDDDRFFVYGRSNKPCRRCGTPIEAYQLGDPVRWTWSCPRCQPRSQLHTADSR
jgi:endonuclease VIII